VARLSALKPRVTGAGPRRTAWLMHLGSGATYVAAAVVGSVEAGETALMPVQRDKRNRDYRRCRGRKSTAAAILGAQRPWARLGSAVAGPAGPYGTKAAAGQGKREPRQMVGLMTLEEASGARRPRPQQRAIAQHEAGSANRTHEGPDARRPFDITGAPAAGLLRQGAGVKEETLRHQVRRPSRKPVAGQASDGGS